MAKRATAFPKQLYVHIENEGDKDDQYFAASTETEHRDDGQRVAIYELREVRTMRVQRSLK